MQDRKDEIHVMVSVAIQNVARDLGIETLDDVEDKFCDVVTTATEMLLSAAQDF